MQILVLRHHKIADIELLYWVMFSGYLLPEYPYEYPSVWVGERRDSRVGNAALNKGGIPTHPPLKRKTSNV